MSSTIYNKAFSVILTHEFYELAHRTQVNQQLELVPTGACAELMRSGRMRFIRTGQGFDVFYKAYEDSAPVVPVVRPLIELTGELEFIFALRVIDTTNQFMNTTDLNQAGTYRSGNIFFLDADMPAVPPATDPIDTDFVPSLIDQLRPSIFTYTFLPSTPGTVVNLEVNVFPEGSMVPVLTINPVLVNPETGVYSVQIDLSGEPIGRYTIEAKIPAGAVQHTADIYVDTVLSRENIFGLMRITYPDPDYFYEGMPDTISYLFEARSVKWRYYVAIKSVPAGFFATHSLGILDDNTPNPAVYTFAGLDAGVPNSTIKVNGFPTVIITSTAVIPFSETAIPRFYLRQVNPGPAYKTLMSALPNASSTGIDSNNVGVVGEAYAEIFLFLDQVSDP